MGKYQSGGKAYGCRRVQIWLERRKSLRSSPKTILRIMHQYGLLPEMRRRKKYKQMGLFILCPFPLGGSR
ncbi:MAG: transposase [Acidaminococcales bacterium]|nr:transposase [Acidaminococcales bacterium]